MTELDETPMTTPTEESPRLDNFDGQLFAVGSVTGIRSFKMDRYGRLRSPQQAHIFKPGENLATCAYGHKVAKLLCGCGFYAYLTRESNPYYDRDDCVEAIVNGYGRVTIGTQGFRAEKLTVTGLVMPSKNLIRRVFPPNGIAGVVIIALLAILGISLGIAFGGDPNRGNDIAPFYVLPGIALILCVTIEIAEHSLKGKFFPFIASRNDRYPAVKRNYPDIPTYRSRNHALRKHPLTAPASPTQFTPDHADFWTRVN